MKGARPGQARPLWFVLALPIFPVRLQTSIFGAGELNCRVRNGNGWTLTAISTNLLFFEKKSKQKKLSSTFFSLPFFSTISYYILCFEKVNPDFLFSCSAGFTSRAPGGAWCAFRDSNPGPTD